MNTGNWKLIKTPASVKCDAMGVPRKVYYTGISGKFGFQERLEAAYKMENAQISAHGTLRDFNKQIPKQVIKSLRNINDYMPIKFKKSVDFGQPQDELYFKKKKLTQIESLPSLSRN